jgi:glutathione synthase/RimK-type ligase-like ATP-grasp enzyme
MKNIAVFFDKPGRDGYPLDDTDYIESYRELSEKIKQLGGQLFVVRTQASYLGGNRFSSGWKYVNGELVDVSAVIETDVIFNKGNLICDEDVTVINIPAVERLCTDKSKTYELFRDLCPRSFIVHNPGELRIACDSIPSVLIVAKPLDKEGGEGVIIDRREAVLSSVTSFPYLIQEFIDTSKGIPGIVDGYHDLRIACVNGEVTHSEFRTPPVGALTANVSRGGTFGPVPKDMIPVGAMEIFLKVENYMQRFPQRIYSVDVGLNADGRWLIIELNSKPGLLPSRCGPDFAYFQDRVAALLTDVAKHGIIR